MKAFVCTTYGPPDVLALKTLDQPIPKAGEFLVRIHATAVNSGDVRVRGLVVEGVLKVVMRLVLGWNKPRKPILGTVLSGEIVEVGAAVKKFSLGDEVMAMTGFNFGTFAEYVVLNEKSIVGLKPKNASHKEAAAIIFGGSTAIHFLEKSKISTIQNAKVLIYGASGAVGTSAIQIAKHFGAEVTAVCSGGNHDLVERLGARHVLDHTNSDWLGQAEKYDLVFDAVGKISYKMSRSILKPQGKFLTVGGLDVASETVQQLDLLRLLFENKQLDAVVDRVYPFDELVEAHRYVDSGKKKGNVVVSLIESEVIGR
jgi:NADPH:quinone reductase-like Zn-dependent oxidoreductase